MLESKYMRKYIVGRGPLMTSRNGNQKLMQTIRITNRPDCSPET